MTPQERKVFEQALEALEREARGYAVHDELQIPRSMRDAIVAINEALAQPEQAGGLWIDGVAMKPSDMEAIAKTWPSETPQRKPLTDEEIDEIGYKVYGMKSSTDRQYARAIEAAHGIKE